MTALAGELAAGRRLLAHADWASARDAYAAALQIDESAEAREGLGIAQWFLGEIGSALESHAVAFELRVRQRQCGEAARVAAWISHQHLLAGRLSVARGWLSRAARALIDEADCPGHGWVAVETARQSAEVNTRIAHAGEAVEIARRHAARPLEILALSVLGRARVEAGDTDAGMLLLEEAMAGATAEQLSSLHTLAEAYCNLLLASTSVGDWARAAEWCEQVDTFARSHHTAPLFGTCQGVHADVLLATGHWPEAEEALATALRTHAAFVPTLGDPAAASLAALRVRQGRLAEAEELLVDRGSGVPALYALALLRTAQHRYGAAAVLLERALQSCGGAVVAASLLLGELVAVRLRLDDVVGARQVSSQLTRLGESCTLRLVSSRAWHACGLVRRAEGGYEEAADHAGRALAGFVELAMPLEAAYARLALARCFAARGTPGSDDAAAEEAEAAHHAFVSLGASTDAAEADALVRRWRAGVLTPREREVLDLVALGRSNADIAAALVITEKTAGHHVSHILTKLGVRNRTEAARHLRDR